MPGIALEGAACYFGRKTNISRCRLKLERTSAQRANYPFEHARLHGFPGVEDCGETNSCYAETQGVGTLRRFQPLNLSGAQLAWDGDDPILQQSIRSEPAWPGCRHLDGDRARLPIARDAAFEGKARNGRPTGGRAYGDVAARDSVSGERAIYVKQAATVLKTFDWYASGKSPRFIAAELNRLGCPLRVRRGIERVSGFTPSAVKDGWPRPFRVIASVEPGFSTVRCYVGAVVWGQVQIQYRPPFPAG